MKERVLKFLALLVCLCLAFSTACTSVMPSGSKESVSGSESGKESVSGSETTGESEKESVTDSEKESVSSSESETDGSEETTPEIKPTYVKEDGVLYGLYDGYAIVTGKEQDATDITIKGMVNGVPVIEIEEEAFRSCSSLHRQRLSIFFLQPLPLRRCPL